jgi:hypothetical protein
MNGELSTLQEFRQLEKTGCHAAFLRKLQLKDSIGSVVTESYTDAHMYRSYRPLLAPVFDPTTYKGLFPRWCVNYMGKVQNSSYGLDASISLRSDASHIWPNSARNKASDALLLESFSDLGAFDEANVADLEAYHGIPRISAIIYQMPTKAVDLSGGQRLELVVRKEPLSADSPYNQAATAAFADRSCRLTFYVPEDSDGNELAEATAIPHTSDPELARELRDCFQVLGLQTTDAETKVLDKISYGKEIIMHVSSLHHILPGLSSRADELLVKQSLLWGGILGNVARLSLPWVRSGDGTEFNAAEDPVMRTTDATSFDIVEWNRRDSKTFAGAHRMLEEDTGMRVRLARPAHGLLLSSIE